MLHAYLKVGGKTIAVIVLESCGFRARIGLRVLEQKSLITISENGYMHMHDHIEEMGKNIVRRKPERHSRLWIKEEIIDILANNKGTRATKCITLDAVEEVKFENLRNGLANMKELRFLHVYGPSLSSGDIVSFNEVGLHLPNALRFLKWAFYPFSNLPKTFQAKNLVGLEMEHSKIVQLWKDGEEKPFLKLRFLKFTLSKLRTLDLSAAPNLETLILEYCENLEKLHMPAESPKLRSLYLNHLKLRTLHLGITPNLETLRVKYCTYMVELHMPSECPKLVTLQLYFCNRLKEINARAECLESLILSKCTLLQDLPKSICEMKRLKSIDLSHCIGVKKLPEEIGRLECLKDLNIKCTGISYLPRSIHWLEGLRIVGDRGLLKPIGSTLFKIRRTSYDEDEMFCYIP